MSRAPSRCPASWFPLGAARRWVSRTASGCVRGLADAGGLGRGRRKGVQGTSGRGIQPPWGAFLGTEQLRSSPWLRSLMQPLPSLLPDFLCEEAAGDSPVQPQSRHEPSCHKDSTPPLVSSCSCSKNGTWAGSAKGGCSPPAWPAVPIHGRPASPTSSGAQTSWPAQAGDEGLAERLGPSCERCVGSRVPSDEEAL